MKIKENFKKVWTGNHLGISFEINNWTTPANSIEDFERHHWTYYIYIHIDRIPEQYKPLSFWLRPRKDKAFKYTHYDYYKHPIIGGLEFHCGITWYSKEEGFDGTGKVIKIGCDYQHYWDEGKTYQLRHILPDVENTINDLRNKMPEYKYLCNGNWKLYNIEDGILKDDEFYSTEYWGDKEWFIKLKESVEI